MTMSSGPACVRNTRRRPIPSTWKTATSACRHSRAPALRRYQDEVDAGNAYFLRTSGPPARAGEGGAGDLPAVAPEEILITRSAVESLNIVLQGYPFARGDGIVMARHDYDSARTSSGCWRHAAASCPPSSMYRSTGQRRQRRRLVRRGPDAVGPGPTADPYRAPYRPADAGARRRGHGACARRDVIVDGAHTLAQLDYTLPDLGVQFGAFNLHKRVGAPLGTGLLYIARERIADIRRCSATSATRRTTSTSWAT